MSLSRLLGTDKAAAEAAEKAVEKAADDAKEIRRLEQALRAAEGMAGDRGRQLEVLQERVAIAEARAAEHEQRVYARDWQLEQQRELARKMKQLAEELTQPVLGPQGLETQQVRGVPVDRGPMTDAERALWQKQRDDQDIAASEGQRADVLAANFARDPAGLTQAMADHYEELDKAEEAKRAAEGHR